MTRTAAVGLAGVAAGVLLAWLLIGRGGEEPAPGSTVDSPTPAVALALGEQGSEVEQLRAELEIEREIRRRLAEEIEALRREAAAPAPALASTEARHPDPAAGGSSKAEAKGAASAADGAWFSTGDLLALGLDEREIERIREAWDRYEMARIELQHSMRRGSSKEERKGHAVQATAIEMRAHQELGDAGYDALLYASGQENRVILTEILETSPAAAAGLSSGDELLRYDGQRVFRPRHLLQLVSTGERGEWVEVMVRRGGSVQRFHVERGPLGVRLGSDRRVPYLE